MTARRRSRPEVRRAFTRFVALNLLAIVVVGAAAIAWSIHVARAQAVAEAARNARSIATGVIGPLCTPALRRQDPAALARLDDIVRNRMRDGSILRVKIWAPDGLILYSDASSLIGRTFPLEADDVALFGTDRAKATISTLARPENRLEASAGRRLVETYAGMLSTDGRPLLFEAYFRGDVVDANARAIAWDLTPVALLTIVALQFLQLPLAIVLARRLDRAHGEHARLLEHAVAAADLERRRLATALHDGVIQDLAGVGFTLESIESQLGPADDRLRTSAGRAAGIVQRDLRELRDTLVGLTPPDLRHGGLESSINDLVAPLRESGVRCHVRLGDLTGLPEATKRLLYRSARELLRNVAKHARATEVSVVAEAGDGRTVLVVTDDGTGFDPAAPPAGHLGLHLLAEAVRDAGGELVTTTAAGTGTSVRVALGE